MGRDKKKVDLQGQNQFNTPHAQIAKSAEHLGKSIENPLRFLIRAEVSLVAQSVEW